MQKPHVCLIFCASNVALYSD